LQRSLLRWYEVNQRDLPWRKHPDPYRTLVSEFMLQQTRIDTVIPYFERFLNRFPDLPALARAPLSRVLQAWAGLGYYARARNLHQAARTIMRAYGGEIPRHKEVLLLLPGFGSYIAGAVASLAFHEPVAAIDGNVRRVLVRLVDGCGREGINPKRLERWVENLIPPKRVSDFNQALMDLGALTCLPKQPRCSGCPLKNVCAWSGDDGPKGWKKKVKIKEETWLVALIQNEGRFLLHRKEGQGLLAGLWQFPYLKDSANTGNEKKEKKRLAEMVFKRFGLKIEVKRSLPSQDSFFTHLHAILRPYRCEMKENILPLFPRSMRWVKPAEFSRLAISTAMKNIAAIISE